jgi:hypothetical protein
LLYIDDVVEFLDRREPLPGMLFIHKPGILGLDVGTVGQHDPAEVGGGGGGVNTAPKPQSFQAGQKPGVVDMGVAENNSIQRGGFDRQRAVNLFGLLAASLKEPAIQQQALATDLDQVHRTGYRAGGAPEGNGHGM